MAAADGVVADIAEHRRARQQHSAAERLQCAAGVDRSQRPQGEQQRVPGQERRDHQAGLGRR